MTGFITPCYSDQNSAVFRRGVMRIVNGRRSDIRINRSLLPNELKNRDFYVKPDPDFENGIYSVCHRELRKAVKPGDVIFFRTLWRGRQYFIGYFVVKQKCGRLNNPVCVADTQKSVLIKGYRFVIYPSLVGKINPNANYLIDRHPNLITNEFLGRSYIKLSQDKTDYLLSLFDCFALGSGI